MCSEIRRISADVVEDTVQRLFSEAARILPSDLASGLSHAAERETEPAARRALSLILENMRVAEEAALPVCQDTGMAILFADVGEHVHIDGDTLENAVNRGVARAYRDGALRSSIVADPLYDRKNTNDNTPAILHIRTVAGNRLTLTAAPKGFGSENMSFLRMMTPAAGEEDILSFVVESVKTAGANPCPPIVIGVGIGANFEGVAMLAKRALLRPVGSKNPDPRYAALEERILSAVNETGIGVQGFGGANTALSVAIEQAPTHIAGLPVSVNISCHVLRHRTAVI